MGEFTVGAQKRPLVPAAANGNTVVLSELAVRDLIDRLTLAAAACDESGRADLAEDLAAWADRLRALSMGEAQVRDKCSEMWFG
ncbi:MAG: hypothetical protein ACYC5M_14630 [Anaerolineae bacterium]